MVALRKTAALRRSKLSGLISILLLGATAGCSNRDIETAGKLVSLVVVGAVAVTGTAVGAAVGASDKNGTNRCRGLRFGMQRGECERREQEKEQKREQVRERLYKERLDERYKRSITEYETRIANAFAKRISEAECGNASEQYYLGLMFKIGTEPATEDPVAAYKWLSLAAIHGHAEAEHARDLLAAQMTDVQIAAAESLVGVWELNRLCERHV